MSRPPSARVTSWPLTTDAQREHWDSWATALSAARHPSLARVEEVTRTEDTGTLVVSDPDSESVTAWAERTGASVPERLAVLRSVAAALDALYAGSDSVPGIPHGGLGTEAVRVAADGSTRLVGFAPWAGPENERFHAPELIPASEASRSADAFAMACLVADVLGGPRVAAAGEVGDRIQALRSSPDTRRRARLIRAITSALTDPAEARPHLFTAWLAAAVEGTMPTEVTGIHQGPAVEPAATTTTRKRRLILLVVAGATVLVGLAGWAIGTRDSVDPPTSASRSPGSAHWISAAWTPACGSGTGIAGGDIPSELNASTSPAQLDRVGTRPGRWHSGRLILTFTVPSDRAIDTVLAIKPRVLNQLMAYPNWRVTVVGDCPAPEPVDLDLRFNADRGEFEPAPGSGQDPRFNPITYGFRPVAPVTVAIDATACAANWQWAVDVRYRTSDDKTHTISLTPFYLYGKAQETYDFTLATGGGKPSDQGGSMFEGSDPACSNS